MTREEKQKAIDALKISVPVRAMTQEEFNEYIQAINQVMDWLELEPSNNSVNSLAEAKLKNPKAKTFDILHFIADNAVLSTYEAIEKAYIMGASGQEPCEDAISRKTVIEHICEGKDCYKKNCKGILYNRCPDIEWVNEFPPVTPQQKIGRWIEEVNDYGEVTDWHCSNCYDDSGFVTTCKWDYCPNCGAKMEIEE